MKDYADMYLDAYGMPFRPLRFYSIKGVVCVSTIIDDNVTRKHSFSCFVGKRKEILKSIAELDGGVGIQNCNTALSYLDSDREFSCFRMYNNEIIAKVQDGLLIRKSKRSEKYLDIIRAIYDPSWSSCVGCLRGVFRDLIRDRKLLNK